MSHGITRTNQEDSIRLFVANLRESLPGLKKACQWIEVAEESREQAIKHGEFVGHDKKVKAIASAVENLRKKHAAIAGGYTAPSTAELVSHFQSLHVGAYEARLKASTWDIMYAKLAADAAGQLCLDCLRRMLRAREIVLTTVVPNKLNALLAGSMPLVPAPISYDQIRSLGIDIAA